MHPSNTNIQSTSQENSETHCLRRIILCLRLFQWCWFDVRVGWVQSDLQAHLLQELLRRPWGVEHPNVPVPCTYITLPYRMCLEYLLLLSVCHVWVIPSEHAPRFYPAALESLHERAAGFLPQPFLGKARSMAIFCLESSWNDIGNNTYGDLLFA
jgi:hypothetical protein